MIMKDFITSEQRMASLNNLSINYTDEECVGCGVSAFQISMENGNALEKIFDNSVYTNSGHWYCNDDCYKDSR